MTPVFTLFFYRQFNGEIRLYISLPYNVITNTATEHL